MQHKTLLLFFLIILVLNGCTGNDATSTLMVGVSLGDATLDGCDGYFTVVLSNQSPTFSTNWVGGGMLSISGTSGASIAVGVDGSGNMTMIPARYDDGTALDVYILIDADHNFSPAVGMPSDGDRVGFKSLTINADTDNTVTFTDTDLEVYSSVP